MAHLRVEKPRFLCLEGSASVEAAADAATVAPPNASAARANASAVRTGTSASCAASSVNLPATGAPAPAPSTHSSTASAALGEGAGLPPLKGACPRRFPLLLLSPMTSTPVSPGERVPAARAAGTPHPSAPGAPGVRSHAPSSALPAPVPVAAPRAHVPGLGVWAGQTVQCSQPPSAREDWTSESRRHVAKG
jgi:hypothetical protein